MSRSHRNPSVLIRLLAATLCFGAASAAWAECRTVSSLSVCGDWRYADRAWRVNGDVTVSAGAYGFELAEAALYIQGRNLHGEATFALPEMALPGVNTSYAARGRVSLFTSAPHDDTVEVDGLEIDIEHGQAALVIELEDGMTGNVGGIQISGNSSELVLVPEAGLFYLGGDFFAPNGMPLIDRGAMGFSLGGDLDYDARYPLYDGSDRWLAHREDGHLYMQGQVQISQYPVYVFGRAFCDLDRDDDGLTVFDQGESAGDYAISAEGDVTLGYTVGRVNFSLPVGDGALEVIGGDNGSLVATGRAQMDDLLGDTPLASVISTGRAEAYGWFELARGALSDWEIGFNARSTRIAQLPVASLRGRIDAGGAHVTANVPVAGFGNLEVSGEVQNDGNFSLTGNGRLSKGRLVIANARGTLNPGSLTVSGRLETPMFNVDVSGAAARDGARWSRLALTGRTSITVAGKTISNLDVTVDGGLVRLSGRMRLGGVNINLNGSMNTRGQLSISGRASLTIGSLRLSNATFTVTNHGVRFSDSYSFAGRSFSVQGIVSGSNISGSGSMRRSYSATFAGTGVSLSGTARLSVSNSGASARLSGRACASLFGGEECVDISTSINSSGNVTINFPVVGRKSINIL